MSSDTEIHVQSGRDAGRQLKDLLSGARMAMVTTTEPSGSLASRPLTLQRADEDGTVWFLVDAEAAWLSEPIGPVNVAVATSSTWLSISGSARLVRDQAVLDDLGDPVSDSFFDDGTTPVALRIDTDHADYWDAPGRLVQLLAMGKGVLTGDSPDVGERGRLDQPS